MGVGQSCAQNSSVESDNLERALEIGKSQNKLKVGFYKVTGEKKIARYVFVSSHILRQKNFSFDDVFRALGIDVPNLIFQINSAPDVTDWNLRLPYYKKSLVNVKHSDPKDEIHGLNGPLRHYQGVVRENCKRLLKGTAQACTQAGAVFRIEEVFDDEEPVDYVGCWLSEGSQVPMLGVAELGDFCHDVRMDILTKMTTFNPAAEEEMELELLSKAFKIDIQPWLDKKLKPTRDDKTEKVTNSIPHQKITHLIVSDDSALLEEKLEEAIPTGLIVVHGDEVASQDFGDAIQKGQPIFLYKYTGGAADLACETLVKVETYLFNKRINPGARPKHPFLVNLPHEGYSHPRWLQPLDEHHVDICRQMNVLIENFPDRYNPASVLQIDMFNTSEEKLQDQLTKTMSVVFEGNVELGGQSAESRRITYAWRLRHLLEYNAHREKFKSDVLSFLNLMFSLLSTVVAVLYTYYKWVDTESYVYIDTGVLLNLCLLFPLCSTILRGIYAIMNPIAKSAILKRGATRVECEIYMYRTKVGRYNVKKLNISVEGKSDDGNTTSKQAKPEENNLKVVNPRKIFSSSLDNIWNELSASDISKGVLINPPKGSEPLDDINERIQANIRVQDLMTSALKEPKAKAEIRERKQKEKEAEEEKDGKPSKGGIFSRNRRSSQGSDNDSETSDHVVNVGDTIENDKNSERSHEDVQSDIESQVSNDESRARFLKESKHTLEMRGVDYVDDGLSPLTADEYVKIRLVPIIADFTAKAPKFATMTHLANIVIILISILSSIFSVVGLVVFIPIALAVSATVSAWASYKQSDTRLMQTNSAIHNLHQLLVWWDSLSMIEKRVSANKEYLVQTTESAVQGQVVNTSSLGGDDNEDDTTQKF